MENAITFLQVIETIGVPLIITAMVLGAVYVAFPKFLELWMQRHKDEQQYYANRQKQYDEQMQTVIDLAKQSSVVTAQCTATMERVEKQAAAREERAAEREAQLIRAIEASTRATEASTKSLTDMQTDFRAHDERAERMHLDIRTIRGGGAPCAS